jgi:hypothetical protein
MKFDTITLHVFFFALAVISSAKYEDCDQPPDIENGSSSIQVDENEEYVTATYTCDDGFRLVGKSQMTCDLDTDEWTGAPPKCEKRKASINYPLIE